MHIVGLQKMTLLDFPGKVACTVFLGGCNFRCPFCHNSQLLGADAQPYMTRSELLAFLQKRKGILDGVCITGGEPTLQKDLGDLLRQIKSLGYPVKLDTNGYRPDVLKALVAAGLVDYVAMDVKNSPDRYSLTTDIDADLSRIEESIRFLLSDAVDYELRTTVAEPLHDRSSIEAMANWVAELGSGQKARRFFLQPFVDRDTVPVAGLRTPSDEMLESYRNSLLCCAQSVTVRGKST